MFQASLRVLCEQTPRTCQQLGKGTYQPRYRYRRRKAPPARSLWAITIAIHVRHKVGKLCSCEAAIYGGQPAKVLDPIPTHDSRATYADDCAGGRRVALFPLLESVHSFFPGVFCASGNGKQWHNSFFSGRHRKGLRAGSLPSVGLAHFLVAESGLKREVFSPRLGKARKQEETE